MIDEDNREIGSEPLPETVSPAASVPTAVPDAIAPETVAPDIQRGTNTPSGYPQQEVPDQRTAFLADAAKMGNKFTNIPSTKFDDPNYTYLPNMEKRGGDIFPWDVPGEPKFTARAGESGELSGVTPQGEWTTDKVLGYAKLTGFSPKVQETIDKAYSVSKELGDQAVESFRTPPRIPSLTNPDQRPAAMRMNRQQFQEHLFESIGGNPAAYQPFDEVVIAQANLPQVFNDVFQGKRNWADRGTMNKIDADHWEQEHARYNNTVLNWAKAKKAKMEDSYRFAIGEFDLEQKRAEAELVNIEKDKLRALTAEKKANPDKAPDHLFMFNDKVGGETLHLWNGATHAYEEVIDTSTGKPKLKGEVKLEHVYPTEIKMLIEQIRSLQPSKKPDVLATILAATAGNSDLAKKLMDNQDAGMTEEAKTRVAGYQKRINSFMDKEPPWNKWWDKNGGGFEADRLAIGGSTTPATAAAPVFTRDQLEDELATVMQTLRTTKDPVRIEQAYEIVRNKYRAVPDSLETINFARGKVGLQKLGPVPTAKAGASNTPAETKAASTSMDRSYEANPKQWENDAETLDRMDREANAEALRTAGEPFDKAVSKVKEYVSEAVLDEGKGTPYMTRVEKEKTKAAFVNKQAADEAALKAAIEVRAEKKKIKDTPPDELIKLLIAARDSKNSVYQSTLDEARRLYKGTPTWKKIRAALGVETY